MNQRTGDRGLARHQLVRAYPVAENATPTVVAFPDDLQPWFVAWLQAALNATITAGLSLDGSIGRLTRTAIRAYQRSRGRPVTGLADQLTVMTLVQDGVAPAVRPDLSGTTLNLRALERPGGQRIVDKSDPHPRDLVAIEGVGRKRVLLHRSAAEAYAGLARTAWARGLSQNLLLLTSGYRSSAHQRRLWNNALRRYGSPTAARRWVAPPGSSAHQSGRALDFYLGSSNNSRNVKVLRRTPAFRFVQANAEDFGFYPYCREPWHWEYNPPATVSTPRPRRQ